MASEPLSGQPAAVSFEGLCYDVPEKRDLRSRIATLRNRQPTPDIEAAEIGKSAATRILHSVTGSVRRGESLAVIGPSGAGKSSLLNLLAGRAQHAISGGGIEFDGHVRDSRTKRRIGYCTQDDIFFSKLTVRETLEFTSAIRLEGKWNAAERQAKVDAIVGKLRLAKCLDTRIGDQQFDKGISGGERKRLNIANELLGVPDGGILLLDEPTSGLESAGALTVVRLLRQLAEEGHAIVSTIHQPTSLMWSLFDTVLLLCEGHVVYFGETGRAVEYFAEIGFPIPVNHNPADYIMQLLIEDDIYAPEYHDEESGDSSEIYFAPNGDSDCVHPSTSSGSDVVKVGEKARHYLIRRWRERVNGGKLLKDGGYIPEKEGATKKIGRIRTELQGKRRVLEKRLRDIRGKEDTSGLERKYATSWFTQVRVLGLRALRQKRGALLDGVQLVQLTSIIVICALFWFRMARHESSLDDRMGSLFFFPVFFSFFSAFMALFAFPPEKAVLNKDRSSGAYRLSAYYFAKTCVEIPADCIYPTLFTLVVYWTIGLNPAADRFFLFLVILVFLTLTAQSLGLFISAAMMNVRQAQVLASLLILTCMLTGGFYVERDNIPPFLLPFRHLSFIKYVFAALVRNEMEGLVFDCVEKGKASTIYSDNGTKCPVSGQDVLKGAQLDDSLSVAGNIGVMFLWIVALRLAGYFALKYMHRPHKERTVNE